MTNRFGKIHDLAELDEAEAGVYGKKQGCLFRLNEGVDRYAEWFAEKIGISYGSRQKIHDLLRKPLSGLLREEDELRHRRDFLIKLHHLGLTEATLKASKRVVDVGAGNRSFAEHALSIGIDAEIISVDPRFGTSYYWKHLSPEERGIIDRNTIGSIIQAAQLDANSTDLVLAHDLHFSRPSCPHCHEKHDEDLTKNVEGVTQMRNQIKSSLVSTFRAMTRLLNKKGQVRLYPFAPEKDETMLNALEVMEHDGFKVTFQKDSTEDDDQHYGPSTSDYRIIIQKT